MSLNACAALVERADRDRFRATMAAPVAARRVLFPLYAFNVEVSRAPWVTQEPMIAEMRLQWWRDALEEITGGGPVRKHEVVDALAAVLDAEGAALLDGLVAARRWDVYKDAFEDAAHFDSYIDATSGHLMWTAARLLGPADETTVRDFAYGVGVANFLRGAPALEEGGRIPLVDGSPAGVMALARGAMDRMNAARRARAAVSRDAGHALLAGHMARPVLARAVKQPAAVAQAALDPQPLAQSLRLLHASLRGWWV
ncbi:squalene/phytoene synthase family protein [Yoonia sp.]|uniref:squalene/phytoene synthase family protein n=1 Tax=Yoonia sp. TaxID=2212373 RepID=UPI0019E0210C|nr:squalene/phytoene synthase family protein [Yoonia sp.]MBE0414582.1 squalene/phytoene synthase family protein [Yoonia sp.]